MPAARQPLVALLVVTLAALVLGVQHGNLRHAKPKALRAAGKRRSVERISVFDTGTEGWRILPSLPVGGAASADRAVLTVSADDSPSYFMAPNALVRQIQLAAGQTPAPSVAVQVKLELPETCWTEQGWRCSFRLAVVGTHCSLHRTFTPQSAPTSGASFEMRIDAVLTWWATAPGEASEWKYCSEVLFPDG
jgi:hypothetical protein